VFEFEVFKPGCMVTARGLERFKFQPWGLNGGRCGGAARTTVNPGRPDERDVGRFDALPLKPGDVVRFETAGGGGWGDPLTREPERVLWDVENGFITPAAAERDYGVAILDGKVDEDRTRALRQRMAAEAPPRDQVFDFGPFREAYERVWSVQMRDELASMLYGLPIDARDYVRVELVAEVNRRAKEREVGVADLHDAWQALQQRFSME
jgi:N-methylhydantoinase B